MSAPAPSHGERAHSRLGASVAHRWLNCPGSIALSAGIPDNQTIFAAEGTAAHELAEMCLRAGFKPAAEFIGEMIIVGNHSFEVDEEMAEAVQVYLDTIAADMDTGDILLIEHRFDLSEAVYPGMFGTNDAGLYKVKTGQLKVYDYKHGKGHAVEVDDNPQLKYYGIGMLGVPSLRGVAVSGVELVIVQPRAPHRDGPVRRWATDALELIDFTADLRTGAIATQQPNAKLDAGEWCKFCPAAGVCPALRDKALTDAQLEFAETPAEMTEFDLASLLDKADLVEDWISAVRREAFNRAEGGAAIPGFKLVAKRAIRKWRTEEAAAAMLAFDFGVGEEDLWSKKLRSPAQIEKLIPKTDRPRMAELVTAESSGNTLARETDRRASVAPSRSATDDFDPV